jgi:predicted ABC-type ATPase
MPELYIITGSNGAGKSTIGPDYLPQQINKKCIVFDGDKLFIQKRSELWQTIKAPKEIKKLAHQFVLETFENQTAEALAKRHDYVYEGHFTNDETWSTPLKFKENGYIVTLIFFGLKDPDTSQLRVVERAKEGGHWVDRRTIEDNYYGNLRKLEEHINTVNNIQIVDTTEQHIVLAYFTNGEVASAVSSSLLPAWFTTYLPLLTGIIIDAERKKSAEL